MEVVCVYTMMSRASLEKTQWAEGDVWGLESSAASSLTKMVPCLEESNGSQWELLIHLGLSCTWTSSQHGDFRVVSSGSDIQKQVFQQIS